MAIPILRIPIGSSCIIQGDTIPVINFVVTDYPSLDLLAANVSIKMQLYYNTDKVLDLAVGSGITILGQYEFQIDEILNNTLPCGELKGDLEITETSGLKLTYCRVVYTIAKEYTI